MKTASFVLILLNSLSAYAGPNCLMERIMVTGASVSSGLDGTSFGDQLAQKYETQKKLIHEAYPGVSGSVIVSYSSFAKNAKTASLAVALDFFYWDQIGCDGSDWEVQANKTINILFDKTMKSGVPLVVGNLTHGIYPFNKIKYVSKCAEFINARVKATCEENPKKCLLIDNDEMGKFVADYFTPKLADPAVLDKEQYLKAHVTRDGIHPRTDAYGVMANFLEQKIRTSKLECK